MRVWADLWVVRRVKSIRSSNGETVVDRTKDTPPPLSIYDRRLESVNVRVATFYI
jgi:hypothetical protein